MPPPPSQRKVAGDPSSGRVNFCVNLNLCSEFTETLVLTIEMDILDMMLKWMDMDGSHNFVNGYGWIWISSTFFAWIWMDKD